MLQFLNRIFDREDNIRFIFTCGESFLVREYCQSDWRVLIRKAEEGKMLLLTESSDVVQSLDVPDKFNYREDQIEAYITAINNMVHLQAFRDAKYYLDSIVSFMDRIDSKVSAHQKFRILELLCMVYLGMEDSEITHKLCVSCCSLAEKMDDELLLMNAEIIDALAELGSLKEMFHCDFSYQIKESVLERARKLGNENFLAYMKNIILYSSYGCYQYVREMYEKRLQIIDKDKPVRLAHTCVGLGYNAIILEDFEKADGYFAKGLQLLIENKKAEDIAEALYNMFLNYYEAGFISLLSVQSEFSGL